MTNTELAKELLLKISETDDIKVIRALSTACAALMYEQEKTAPAKAQPEKKEPKKAGRPKKKHVDVGKLKSLLNGGWPVVKIADEFGVSQATIYKLMKEEGLFRGEPNPTN